MQAWDSAHGIYDAKLGLEEVQRTFLGKQELRELFDFSSLQMLESKTGAFIKVKSGFAVIANGKTTSNRDEVLIAIRGTDLISDWLTDANFGIQLSSTGKVVHAGFNRVFDELEPHLSAYFNKNQPTTVHCVGHSLGGALASLTADWVTQKQAGKAKLYSFGSPRVGFSPFATELTENLGAENIFRVHHDNDFVSLVPIWPFCHTPMPGTSCNLRGQGYNTFSAHSMANYERSLTNSSQEWSVLREAITPQTPSREIEKWLSLNTVSVISSYTLSLIGNAIQYILKAAGISIQFLLGTSFTILDKLSYAMEYAWKASKKIAGWVEALLNKILGIVGHGIAMTSDLTRDFIGWVFKLLNVAVNKIVSLTLKVSE